MKIVQLLGRGVLAGVYFMVAGTLAVVSWGFAKSAMRLILNPA